jgi:tetratricopeptide (TPR) repeat protein
MESESLLDWLDAQMLSQTGDRFSHLQRIILQQVWQGQKYGDIAQGSGYTEGYIKDVAALLWQSLTRVLGEKITKNNCRMVIERQSRSVVVTGNTPVARIDEQRFMGRETAIADLNQLILRGCKLIVIQGEGGVGKTTTAQHFFQTHGFEQVLELLMAKESQNITSVESVLEEWLQQNFQQQPGREFGVTLGRLKRHLQEHRLGILIDNLEPSLDPQGRFIAPHRRYLELLRILADQQVQSVTLITSRDRLCEADLNLEHYRLPGLDFATWEQFFEQRGLSSDPQILSKMHQACAGNAKAMGILSGVIQADFDRQMRSYWRVNGMDLLATPALKNLVASQIDRLQILDPPAYRLFCRLGCYRYQDVPRLPQAGLFCQLWDVPSVQHWQVITSLRHRSLLECHQGEYWLHPVMQAEAIARLRNSDDWQPANHRAAEYWSESIPIIITTLEALQALEAYYHYLAIQEFELAGRVILKSRHNQWQQYLSLGSTLYRLGLIQPVLRAIPTILAQLPTAPSLIELHNILGDLYWISGQIQPALECQYQTIALAGQALQALLDPQQQKQKIYYLKMLALDSQLSIGLYQIDLWELQAAAKSLQLVIDQATDAEHYRWAEKAIVCLSLVNVFLGLTTTAKHLADQAYATLMEQQSASPPGRFAYFLQILGQTYANLGEINRAKDLYRQAIAGAESSFYTQIEARILRGLAEIDRHQGDFDSALIHHARTVELFEQIGAQCDLAEAHFQWGLTFQRMGRQSDGEQQFQQAIQLFTAMQAPCQVIKVVRQAKP